MIANPPSSRFQLVNFLIQVYMPTFTLSTYKDVDMSKLDIYTETPNEAERVMIVSRVKEVMDRQGITVRELADRAHITYNTANALYRGYQTRVDLPILDRVCEVLDVQPGDLFVRLPTGTDELAPIDEGNDAS